MYLIAEIGQNHNGSIVRAGEMVDALVGTGVNAIKTAKRDIKSFPEIWKETPYTGKNSFADNYYDHRVKLELNDNEFKALAKYAKKKGFDFISSFTDIASFDFLRTKVQPEYYKIASSRIVDYKLLYYIKEFKLPYILSSGMSSFRDVLLAEELLNPYAVMQCTSSYPTEIDNINLNVLNLYKENFPKKIIGLSGHHKGILPDLIAASMGAGMIERHFTLNKSMKGTDHNLSLERHEFIELANGLMDVKLMMGMGNKRLLKCEEETAKKLRSDLQTWR